MHGSLTSLCCCGWQVLDANYHHVSHSFTILLQAFPAFYCVMFFCFPSSLASSAGGRQLLSRLATAVENLFAPTVSLAEEILQLNPSLSLHLPHHSAISVPWAPEPDCPLISVFPNDSFQGPDFEDQSLEMMDCHRLEEQGTKWIHQSNSSGILPFTTQNSPQRLVSCNNMLFESSVCSGQQWCQSSSCMQAIPIVHHRSIVSTGTCCCVLMLLVYC